MYLYIKYSFYKYYRYSKKLDNLSLKSKYSFLCHFLNDFNKFNKIITKRKSTNEKSNEHDTASELYNEFLETCFDEYYYLSHVQRGTIES